MAQRVYVVKEGNNTYLVQSNSKAKAIKFVVGNRYTAAVAKTVDVADLLSKGVKLEIAQ